MKFVKYTTLIALLAGFAFADSLVLTSAGGNVMGGVYVSPYDATYNGTTNLKVICDDFSAVTHLNVLYNVNTVSYANLPSQLANTRWGGTANALNLYYAAAYLSNQLLNGGFSNQEKGQLSYAIWSLFTPSSLNSLGVGSVNYVAASLKASTALTAVTLAGEAANAAAYSNYVLFVPNPLGAPGAPQEFIALRTPEPGVMAIWMIMLVSAGFIAFAFRRPMQPQA